MVRMVRKFQLYRRVKKPSRFVPPTIPPTSPPFPRIPIFTNPPYPYSSLRSLRSRLSKSTVPPKLLVFKSFVMKSVHQMNQLSAFEKWQCLSALVGVTHIVCDRVVGVGPKILSTVKDLQVKVVDMKEKDQQVAKDLKQIIGMLEAGEREMMADRKAREATPWWRIW